MESWLPHTLAWYWAFSWPPGAPKGPILPKMLLMGVLEVLGGHGRAILGPNSLGLLCLGWTHGYHRFWPGIKPLPGSNFDFWPHMGPTWSKKGTFRAKLGAFGASGCHEEAHYHESNLGTAAGGSWDQTWLPGALRVPPRPPKGAFWAKTSSFGAPGGQEEVQYQDKVCGIQ